MKANFISGSGRSQFFRDHLLHQVRQGQERHRDGGSRDLHLGRDPGFPDARDRTVRQLAKVQLGDSPGHLLHRLFPRTAGAFLLTGQGALPGKLPTHSVALLCQVSMARSKSA